jgi:YD repeat-containing protein
VEKYTPNEGMYSYAFDAIGNQVQVDKPVYGTTYYTFDERDHLRQVDEPGDGGERLLTTYTYDDVGNRLSQMDPNGQKTKYEYDYANRKKTETMYLNGISYTFSFDYDTEGNLLYEEKPGGQWIDYEYDFMNRLANENHSDGRWASYTYYNDGELKTETTIEGTTSYTYYANGQTETISFPNGDLVEYHYDDNGDVDVEIVNGQPREYVRDETGLTSIYTDAKDFTYEYTYDPDGFVDEITLPNGVKTKYDYKPGHLINEKETIAPNGQALYVNTYDHNKRDYITSVDENGRNFAYSYESREQLEQVSTPEGDIRLYNYDGAGNRTTRRAIIGGVEYDRGEVIELEELLEMILLAIKDEEDENAEDGEGKAKGHEKNDSKGNGQGTDKEKGNNKNNGNKKDKTTFLEPVQTEYHREVDPFTIVAYDGDMTQLLAAKGGKNDKDKGNSDKSKDNGKDNSKNKEKDNGKNNNSGQNKNKGKPEDKGWKNALERGNGKKYGLYKKLGLIDGPFEHKTGQVENILAVLDHIVNGEVNLPPGEHEELFELVREVGKGYTVIGTTWEYNERNEIIERDNQIRIESYDYDHDDAGKMTTDGRSIYGWNAKDQLEKVTFPDGFGQTYEYDAKGRRTKKVQLNHQENSQWEVNYHYQGDTWQITHETDQDGKTLKEFTYDERGKPLSITFKGETFWYVYNGQDDVVALTDKNGEIAARYEYDEWGLVTRMYNRHGERIRERIGWMGVLNTGSEKMVKKLGTIP